MKFKKNMKKGFTLVELIVVIAIVAILAAVSVVSYIAFINSANESADIQLVKQLNVALQADETLNGPRDTMHEMLGAMEENGFVVENLTKTKSGYDIVWDQEHNRFGLLNGEGLVYGESTYNSAKAWNIWKFADTEDEAKNKSYSVYLTEEFAKTGVTELNIKAGLDVGNNVINTINYVNDVNHPQTVVIRTNNSETKLTVDAAGDTVHHYDLVGEVEVIKTADNSYHEFGTAGYIQVASGRVVAENGGYINTVILTEKGTGATLPAVIQIKDGGEVVNKYATSQAVVDANNNGSNAYQLTTDNKETGKLITAGEIDDIKEEAIADVSPVGILHIGGEDTDYQSSIFTGWHYIDDTDNIDFAAEYVENALTVTVGFKDDYKDINGLVYRETRDGVEFWTKEVDNNNSGCFAKKVHDGRNNDYVVWYNDSETYYDLYLLCDDRIVVDDATYLFTGFGFCMSGSEGVSMEIDGNNVTTSNLSEYEDVIVQHWDSICDSLCPGYWVVVGDEIYEETYENLKWYVDVDDVRYYTDYHHEVYTSDNEQVLSVDHNIYISDSGYGMNALINLKLENLDLSKVENYEDMFNFTCAINVDMSEVIFNEEAEGLDCMFAVSDFRNVSLPEGWELIIEDDAPVGIQKI